MNFIQKRIEQKRLEQEEQLRKNCSYSVSYLDIYINTLKNDIKTCMLDPKNITIDDAGDLLWDLEQIERHYNSFLHDLKQQEFTSKTCYVVKYAEDAKQKAEFMHKIRQQYRKEFESIYDTFKRVSKGRDFPRRNEILGKMRKAFDFDSSKYYSNDDQFVLMR